MAHEYHSFLTAIEPLLPSHDADLQPTQPPHIMHLHPGMPTLELGAVSSLYELTFNPPPSADLKTGLGIETQLCRNSLFDAAREIEDCDLFLGMDAVWMSPYEPITIIPPPTSPESTTEPNEQTESSNPTSLLVMTEWASQDAEKRILDSGRMGGSHGGQVMTVGEYFGRNLLQRASAYTRHEVLFENVSAANVEWLDKEEKWTTYVRRLLAEEAEQTKHEEAAEPTISGVDETR